MAMAKKPPRIHIFQGDPKNMQIEPFIGALHELRIPGTSYEVMTFSKLKDNIRFRKWTQDTLFEWFVDCDIYIIICHIHQGFSFNPINWDPVQFYQRLYTTLKDKRGFPSGEHLRCPVFTQDKQVILQALDRHGYVNPTMIVPIVPHYDYDDILRDVEDFQLEHNEGRGLVVKAGYITNHSHYHHTGIQTPASAISKIKTIRKQVFEHTSGYAYPVPYVIVQPCMFNRLEKKIVCVNGLYHYTTHPSCSGDLGHEYRFEGDMEDRCRLFSEHVIRVLKAEVPECILEGLVRVDVFETALNDKDGDPIWVVNEIETLEAAYGTPDGTAESNARTAMTAYWVSVLLELFQGV